MIDFMSSIRKIPFSKLSTFNDVFESMWKLMTSVSKFDTIHIVYDSYIDDSIKEAERIRRAKESDPLEYIDISLQSQLPVQLDRFWACSRNKEKIKTLSRSFFSDKSKVSNKTIILSGYTSYSRESFPAEKYIEVSNNILTELELPVEEADLRIILHVQHAIKQGNLRVIVTSNDTDVVVLLIHYYKVFQSINELWIYYGTGEKARYIPIHRLNSVIEEATAIILTGSDVTSKIGTKASAYKYAGFAATEVLTDEAIKVAERYLVQDVDHCDDCKTFDELIYKYYMKKNKSIIELPPTSRTINNHILRSFYFVKSCRSLLDGESLDLDPLHYGWKNEFGLILPEKGFTFMPNDYPVTCNCTKKCGGRCGCSRLSVFYTEYCKYDATNCQNQYSKFFFQRWTKVSVFVLFSYFVVFSNF